MKHINLLYVINRSSQRTLEWIYFNNPFRWPKLQHNERGLITELGLPLIKGLQFSIVLKATLVNQEFHSLKERRRDCRWLFAQQHINRFGSGHTQLARPAYSVRATFGVLAVNQTI